MNKQTEEIARQIIETELPDEIIQHIKAEFFQIMRANKIYKGESSKNSIGTICDNFEWTMCKTLFLDVVRSHIEISIFFDTPKDVFCKEYDKEDG